MSENAVTLAQKILTPEQWTKVPKHVKEPLSQRGPGEAGAAGVIGPIGPTAQAAGPIARRRLTHNSIPPTRLAVDGTATRRAVCPLSARPNVMLRVNYGYSVSPPIATCARI